MLYVPSLLLSVYFEIYLLKLSIAATIYIPNHQLLTRNHSMYVKFYELQHFFISILCRIGNLLVKYYIIK